MESLVLRYGLKGKARTRPDFFKVVLGPCVQFCPCEASEQTWGKTPKMGPQIVGGLNQNSALLVSQELSPLTAAKKIME